MKKNLHRREFLKSMAATSVVASIAASTTPRIAVGAAQRPQPSGEPMPAAPVTSTSKELASRMKLRTFNYDGVRLLPSRWSDQFQHGRDFYYGVSNDDILQGFRAEAGLSAPGKPLGGWCEKNSNTVFGQWLSGMSRIYRATNDTDMRDKASYLMTEFAKTVGPDGNCRMGLYPYEKLVCGLTDMYVYAGQQDAIPLLERVTDYASKTFDRTRAPAAPKPWIMHSGKPLEWYTMPENLFRAYVATDNQQFKDFAEVWLYHAYWDKFANTADPPDAHGVHAYSHVNTFSSAAMTYGVTGDSKYLNIIKNAYDFLQNHQCYATGGYGPVERIMPPGSIGKALEYQPNNFEAPCGSWAGFKLSHYLTQFTGEARYGDWAERLLYNGVGAALKIHGAGRHFYYADYRVGSGVKIFSRNAYTCCSGTYIQNIADFHNLIYYQDDANFFVSLYVPSEATWRRPGGDVTITQETNYPEEETSTLTLKMNGSQRFAMELRVPAWSPDASIKVNGSPAGISCTPGEWATIDRSWNSGDRVEMRIPLRLRMQAVEAAYPKRVAVVRGPVVLIQDGMMHEPIFELPSDPEELNSQLAADKEGPSVFKLVPPDKTDVQAKFRPFYSINGDYYYRMYFDLDKLPMVLWDGPGPKRVT
ncbi:MAG TPA: beta-L-arabinofuranosidase domain-containing protein [Candidatus Acidoferrales bacterium]|nr:beta-L-arabinofuranosidase domain-containing protein [Candidatus Acidoferrales bacterium]